MGATVSWRSAVLVALLSVPAFLVYRYLTVPNKALVSHRPGPCRQIAGTEFGSEDLELVRLKDRKFILVSSGIRPGSTPRVGQKGQILTYDFTKADAKAAEPLEIVLGEGSTFNKDVLEPHGISSFKIDDNSLRLFVINHNQKFEHSVEVFDWSTKNPRQLVHRRTIRSPTFTRPNDLVAIDANRFFLTNDGAASQNELAIALEYITGYKGGSVVFFDGSTAHVLLSSLPGPNGIALDPKRKVLFLSLCGGVRLNVYDVSEDYRSLLEISSVPLPDTMPDNLFIAADGSIFIGAHPCALCAIAHLANIERPAPSEILRVEFGSNFKDYRISSPYADAEGLEAVASATAIFDDDHLLIGTVFRSLVHCRVAYPHF